MAPRKYRIVPSEKAGYLPGLAVVQYRDVTIGRWFDIGDPKPRDDAEQQRRDLESRDLEGRVS